MRLCFRSHSEVGEMSSPLSDTVAIPPYRSNGLLLELRFSISDPMDETVRLPRISRKAVSRSGALMHCDKCRHYIVPCYIRSLYVCSLLEIPIAFLFVSPSSSPVNGQVLLFVVMVWTIWPHCHRGKERCLGPPGPVAHDHNLTGLLSELNNCTLIYQHEAFRFIFSGGSTMMPLMDET